MFAHSKKKKKKNISRLVKENEEKGIDHFKFYYIKAFF